MRPAAALIAVAALGALTAFALPRTGHAANPKLFGTVGPLSSISFKDSEGHPVMSIPAGTYDIEVTDTETTHNFDLLRPDTSSERRTDIVGTGTETWTDVVLTPGMWTYQCDAHAYFMMGTFTVTGDAITTTTTVPTTTGATTTTGPTTTVPPTTTTRGPGEPCVVPKLVGRTLPAARRRLARTSCRLGRVTRAYSRRFARGRVMSQRPRAGSRVGNGTAVKLVVSRGRRR